MRNARLFASAVVFATCLPLAVAIAADPPTTKGDIVTVAAEAGNFQTLVAAIKLAGLQEKLQSEGPFTVFAPTDEAFAKLPTETLKNLLKPENKADLTALLACHVLPGKVMAADVKTMKVATVSGQELSLKVEDGKVTVENAKVVKTDIAATNGVIHAIDTVLLPAAAAEHPGQGKPKDHPGH
jgi:uncharacterized surface protein with fasciclin (FAS1) repeats